MLLQPCSTHGNKFQKKFNLEKNKMAMSKKNHGKEKLGGPGGEASSFEKK
jgi:hypothetical protein